MIKPGIFGKDESFTEYDWIYTSLEDIKCDHGDFVGGVEEAPRDVDLSKNFTLSPINVFDLLLTCRQRLDLKVKALGVADRHQVGFAACIKRGDCVCAIDTSIDQLAETFVSSRFIDAFAEKLPGRGALVRRFGQLETVSMSAESLGLSQEAVTDDETLGAIFHNIEIPDIFIFFVFEYPG